MIRLSIIVAGFALVQGTLETRDTIVKSVEELCADPRLRYTECCKESSLLNKKIQKTIAIYDSVRNRAVVMAEDPNFGLSPIEGALMDAWIDMDEAGLIRDVTPHVSAQYLRAVFQRHIDRLVNSASSAVRKNITDTFKAVMDRQTELEDNLRRAEQELEEVRLNFQTRMNAADQFHRRYLNLSKLMTRYRDKAESCTDQYFADFSMYKKLLVNKMDRLAACEPELIETQVRDIAEYIISLGVRGMNHRSMWRLCRQSFEAIGNAPEVLSKEIVDKLSVLPYDVINAKTALDEFKKMSSVADAQELHSKLVSLSL